MDGQKKRKESIDISFKWFRSLNIFEYFLVYYFPTAIITCVYFAFRKREM